MHTENITEEKKALNDNRGLFADNICVTYEEAEGINIDELKIRFADYLISLAIDNDGMEDDAVGRAAIEVSDFIKWLEREQNKNE